MALATARVNPNPECRRWARSPATANGDLQRVPSAVYTPLFQTIPYSANIHIESLPRAGLNYITVIRSAALCKMVHSQESFMFTVGKLGTLDSLFSRDMAHISPLQMPGWPGR